MSWAVRGLGTAWGLKGVDLLCRYVDIFLSRSWGDDHGTCPEEEVVALVNWVVYEGGIFPRACQLFAERLDLAEDDAYRRALSRCMATCLAAPYEEVEEVLRSADVLHQLEKLGDISRQPIATNCVGQVHLCNKFVIKVVLDKKRREVENQLAWLDAAVKLPGLSKSALADMRRAIAPMRSIILEEFDLSSELENLRRADVATQEIQPLLPDGFPAVHVPEAVTMSSAHVLVMERREGALLTELLERSDARAHRWLHFVCVFLGACVLGVGWFPVEIHARDIVIEDDGFMFLNWGSVVELTSEELHLLRTLLGSIVGLPASAPVVLDCTRRLGFRTMFNTDAGMLKLATTAFAPEISTQKDCEASFGDPCDPPTVVPWNMAQVIRLVTTIECVAQRAGSNLSVLPAWLPLIAKTNPNLSERCSLGAHTSVLSSNSVVFLTPDADHLRGVPSQLSTCASARALVCEAGPDVESLGFTLVGDPPGRVCVKGVLPGTWASKNRIFPGYCLLRIGDLGMTTIGARRDMNLALARRPLRLTFSRDDESVLSDDPPTLSRSLGPNLSKEHKFDEGDATPLAINTDELAEDGEESSDEQSPSGSRLRMILDSPKQSSVFNQDIISSITAGESSASRRHPYVARITAERRSQLVLKSSSTPPPDMADRSSSSNSPASSATQQRFASYVARRTKLLQDEQKRMSYPGQAKDGDTGPEALQFHRAPYAARRSQLVKRESHSVGAVSAHYPEGTEPATFGWSVPPGVERVVPEEAATHNIPGTSASRLSYKERRRLRMSATDSAAMPNASNSDHGVAEAVDPSAQATSASSYAAARSSYRDRRKAISTASSGIEPISPVSATTGGESTPTQETKKAYDAQIDDGKIGAGEMTMKRSSYAQRRALMRTSTTGSVDDGAPAQVALAREVAVENSVAADVEDGAQTGVVATDMLPPPRTRSSAYAAMRRSRTAPVVVASASVEEQPVISRSLGGDSSDTRAPLGDGSVSTSGVTETSERPVVRSSYVAARRSRAAARQAMADAAPNGDSTVVPMSVLASPEQAISVPELPPQRSSYAAARRSRAAARAEEEVSANTVTAGDEHEPCSYVQASATMNTPDAGGPADSSPTIQMEFSPPRRSNYSRLRKANSSAVRSSAAPVSDESKPSAMYLF